MTASDTIAVSSVVIATLAFLATFWQAQIARRHNRLSVRPLLVWHSQRMNTPTGTRIAFIVKNHGLGPALVRARFFTKDGNRFYPPNSKTDEVGDFVAYILGKKIQYHLHRYALPGKDAAIPSGVEMVIADLEFPTVPPTHFDAVQKLVGDVDFHVLYESLYEEKFELHGSGRSGEPRQSGAA